MWMIIRVLLLLLLILIATSCLILFYPISYHVKARKEEENTNIIGKICWLLGAFRLTLEYVDTLQIRIYILCLKIYDSCKPKKVKGHNKKKNKPSSDEIKESKNKKNRIVKNSNIVSDKENEGRIEEIEAEIQNVEETKAYKSKELFQGIKNKIIQFAKNIKDIFDDIQFYMELLEQEETRQLCVHLKRRILKILKQLLPAKMKMKLLVGTGNPDTTGYILALYGMLSAFLTKKQKVEINGDFEQSILEGFVDVKGCFTIGCLLWNLLRILIDKNFIMIRQRLKYRMANKQKSE